MTVTFILIMLQAVCTNERLTLPNLAYKTICYYWKCTFLNRPCRITKKQRCVSWQLSQGCCLNLFLGSNQESERFWWFVEIKGTFFFRQMHVVCRLMETSAPALLSSEQADVTDDHSRRETPRSTYRCLNLTRWWAQRVPPTVAATVERAFK